jgi:hypothetical protein
MNYNIPRQSSYPFITGDTYRDIGDCVLDESSCPVNVQECANFPGAVIFVKIDFEESWFRNYHPNMPHPYVLVTCDGDYSAPCSAAGEQILKARDPKLIMWFGCNARLTDQPLLQAVPHGVNNVGRPNGEPGHHARIWGGTDPLADTIQRWETKLAYTPAPDSKEPFKYMFLFTVQNNPGQRGPAREALLRNGFKESPRGPYDSTVQDVLLPAHFSFSPPGNGIDCVRHYESFMSGAIPIIKTGPLDGLFKTLPHVLVTDYSVVTWDFLRVEWARIQREWKEGKYDMRPTFFPYWLAKIYTAAGRT